MNTYLFLKNDRRLFGGYLSPSKTALGGAEQYPDSRLIKH
jgi:hypothetical protein